MKRILFLTRHNHPFKPPFGVALKRGAGRRESDRRDPRVLFENEVEETRLKLLYAPEVVRRGAGR